MLGFADDSPTVGDFRRVVRNADFVVKELAANVADQTHQLTGLVEELTLRVEIANALGQGSQQGLEIPSPSLIVRLFLLHGLLNEFSHWYKLTVVTANERCYDGTQVAQGTSARRLTARGRRRHDTR